ncbi:MAG: preprotein translocase subunit SecE [Vulcanococcus sp.]
MDPQTDQPSAPERPSSGSPSGTDATTTVASDDASAGGPGGGGGFFADTVEELRKVVWPSRQQLFGESVAVILMVTLSAFAIAAVDRFYSWGNSQVFR